jgi:arginyl-tRNA synthetase
LKHEESQLFLSFLAVGPYVNVVLHGAYVAQQVLKEIDEKKAEYGRGEATGKELLIEGRNINTHKAVHIGHIRNILMSEAVARISAFGGDQVIRVCYPGDI